MISAKVIADSINTYTGTRLLTYELEYPRFIHAEFMTHKMIGKNAQSSRAVPVASTIEVNQNWVQPVVWGKNKAGMSSNEVLEGDELSCAKLLWDQAAEEAFYYSNRLASTGLHKQWANRVTEPFSLIKVIATGTEWDNFFWLRDDKDAVQPEFYELVQRIKEARDNSDPMELAHGEWHMPYIDWYFTEYQDNTQRFYDSDGRELGIDEALKISASCCAQVSYRKLNDSKEKALEIYGKLFSGPKPHMSPTEHQGMCFDPTLIDNKDWPIGVSHIDRKGNYWSANLKDFVQYRQLIQQN